MSTDAATVTVNVPTEGQPAVVPLPSGHLACVSCGVAVPPPFRVLERIETGGGSWTNEPPPGALIRGAAVGQKYVVGFIPMTRCATCTLTRERAAELLAEHPRVRARIGGADVALYRLGSALDGLDALASFTRPPQMTTHTDRAVRILIDTMLASGAAVRWLGRLEEGTCASTRWAHITDEQRAALSTGAAAMLKARNEAAQAFRLVWVEPPADTDLRGCLLCGVKSVEAMYGVRDEVWTAETISPRSVGGSPSGAPLVGYTCPTCSRAVERAGAAGATAMERALMMFLGYPEQLLSATELVGLRAWAVVAPTKPNRTPWDHMDTRALRDQIA